MALWGALQASQGTSGMAVGPDFSLQRLRDTTPAVSVWIVSFLQIEPPVLGVLSSHAVL